MDLRLKWNLPHKSGSLSLLLFLDHSASISLGIGKGMSSLSHLAIRSRTGISTISWSQGFHLLRSEAKQTNKQQQNNLTSQLLIMVCCTSPGTGHRRIYQKGEHTLTNLTYYPRVYIRTCLCIKIESKMENQWKFDLLDQCGTVVTKVRFEQH